MRAGRYSSAEQARRGVRAVEVIRPRGLVLSGGNDLTRYGGDCPERDETEWALLDLAVERAIPVFGVCRGLQAIAVYFGASLERVEGHVAARHTVTGVFGTLNTNSYHAFATVSLPTTLQAIAHAEDGHIEALRHLTLPITAVMWHPEREPTLSSSDQSLIENHFAESAVAGA